MLVGYHPSVLAACPNFVQTTHLDVNAFLHVKSLRCAAQMLPFLLPADAPVRRPIRSVSLDGDMNDIVRALVFLPNSACAVTRLTILAEDPSQLYFGTFDLSNAKASLAQLTTLRLSTLYPCDVSSLVCAHHLYPARASLPA